MSECSSDLKKINAVATLKFAHCSFTIKTNKKKKTKIPEKQIQANATEGCINYVEN